MDFLNIDIIGFPSCRMAYRMKGHRLERITRVIRLQSAWAQEVRLRIRIIVLPRLLSTPVNTFCAGISERFPSEQASH
jgi:hypothetical protein